MGVKERREALEPSYNLPKNQTILILVEVLASRVTRRHDPKLEKKNILECWRCRALPSFFSRNLRVLTVSRKTDQLQGGRYDRKINIFPTLHDFIAVPTLTIRSLMQTSSIQIKVSAIPNL